MNLTSSTRPWLMPVVAWAVAFWLVLLWAWWRWGSAADALETARGEASIQQRQIDRLAELRQQGVAVTGARPDADLVARVHQSLAAAGVPPTACQGITPRSEPGGTGGVRRVSAQVQLRGLSPADLGGWLGAWQGQNPAWQVIGLDVARIAGQGNRFDATVLMAATSSE